MKTQSKQALLVIQNNWYDRLDNYKEVNNLDEKVYLHMKKKLDLLIQRKKTMSLKPIVLLMTLDYLTCKIIYTPQYKSVKKIQKKNNFKHDIDCPYHPNSTKMGIVYTCKCKFSKPISPKRFLR
jgi:hypothetical protein